MIYSIRLLAQFTRDLLNQPAGDVVNIGRDNIKRDDFTKLQIIIDDIAGQTLIGKSKTFNKELEIMRHSQKWHSSMTIDFFGDGASVQAQKFVGLLDSQRAEDLKRDLGMTLYYTTSFTNVKLLTGEQYSERLQLAINLDYVVAIDDATQRIDELQFELIESA